MAALFNPSLAITAAAVFTSFHKVVARRDSVHISDLNTLSGKDKVPDMRFPCYCCRCHHNCIFFKTVKRCHAAVRMCYCKCAACNALRIALSIYSQKL